LSDDCWGLELAFENGFEGAVEIGDDFFADGSDGFVGERFLGMAIGDA